MNAIPHPQVSLSNCQPVTDCRRAQIREDIWRDGVANCAYLKLPASGGMSLHAEMLRWKTS